MTTEEILTDLVAIESVFPHEGKIGDYLERYLRGIGFRTLRQRVARGRYNIFAERGTGKKALLFYGHMDTVPIYGNWNSDPLRLTRKGDQLYGIGSCDMKGGIAAILEALRTTDTHKRIKVLFCVDEENISKGVWTAVNRKRWLKDVLFTISVEPGDSPKQTGGANVVTVGRRGRVVLSVDIEGVSSHGANPQRGVNALEEAAKIALAMRKFKLRKHAGFGSEAVFVNAIEGRSSSLSVPDKAHMEIDLQLVPPDTIQSARTRVEGLMSRLHGSGTLNHATKTTVSVKKRETPYINPYANDLSHWLIKSIFKMVRRNFGSVIVNYGSSVADDNVLFGVTNAHVITIGPRGGNIHTSNEWVSRKSLAQVTKLYSQIILEVHT